MTNPATGPILRYISHAEVEIDPEVPVPAWGLNANGRNRVRAMLGQPWISSIGRIVSSAETKAVETATVLADHRGLEVEVRVETGETDRTVPGYLPKDEFEIVAAAFFSQPERSARGWERACDAQDRVVTALADLLGPGQGGGPADVVVVGHGGVGTLWYCHLSGQPIDQRHDQPSPGHYFSVEIATGTVLHPWYPIDRIEG